MSDRYEDFTDNLILKYSDHLVPYHDALNYMESLVSAIYEKRSKQEIWFLEHDNLFTAGTSAKSEELLNADLFPIFTAGRGGKYTYHGPKMRIIYLMLDLNLQQAIGKDVRKYVYSLEQVVINSLAYFGINGERREDRIGIWVVMPDGKESKIAALGIRIRKWVTYHGISININPNLDNFKGIVPCGINASDYGVTSLWQLGVKIDLSDFDKVFCREFYKIFYGN